MLFVVDQDLRAPEVAAIKRLTATGKPLYVILNKSDQFNAGSNAIGRQWIRLEEEIILLISK